MALLGHHAPPGMHGAEPGVARISNKMMMMMVVVVAVK